MSALVMTETAAGVVSMLSGTDDAVTTICADAVSGCCCCAKRESEEKRRKKARTDFMTLPSEAVDVSKNPSSRSPGFRVILLTSPFPLRAVGIFSIVA
jgi:hypothetical protein